MGPYIKDVLTKGGGVAQEQTQKGRLRGFSARDQTKMRKRGLKSQTFYGRSSWMFPFRLSFSLSLSLSCIVFINISPFAPFANWIHSKPSTVHQPRSGRGGSCRCDSMTHKPTNILGPFHSPNPFRIFVQRIHVSPKVDRKDARHPCPMHLPDRKIE